jgi:hypothetical protein
MLIFALLLQAAAPPAPAAPPPGLPQPPATMAYEPAATLIATFDADGDARVSRAEFDAGVRRSFAAADTPKAGTLGYIGFADWAERYLGDRNALPSPFETDSNGDNRISLPELQTKLGEFFTRYDRDKDNAVTRAELLTIRARAFGDEGDRDGKKRKPPRR